MTKRVEIGIAYPPRAMRAEQAAAYLSVSQATFLRLVDEGTMPPPIKHNGVTWWDRLDIDSAFEELKHGDGSPSGNTVQKRLQELQDAWRGQRR